MKTFTKVLFSLLLLVALPVIAATPPAWINFQGRLLDNNGIPVTQSSMAFIVKIWTDPTSTAPANLKYSESHTVDVDDGVYSFPVGSGTPISGAYGGSLYANNSVLWLEITVESETLLPRHRLLSAPYTNHSGNSENLGGNPASYFGTAAQVTSLQNQINGLSGQLAGLESVCVAGGDIWDVDTCYPGTKVIDYQGKLIPVEQDGVELALPSLVQECFQKHYRPVLLSIGNPMDVLDCDSNLVDPPQDPCRFGPVASAMTIKTQDCALMLEQQTVGK